MWEGPGSKQYPEQGLASFPVSGILPSPDFQCGSLHPSLPFNVESRSFDIYP